MRLQLDLKLCVTKQRRVFVHQTRGGLLAVVGIQFHTDAVSPVLERGISPTTLTRLRHPLPLPRARDIVAVPQNGLSTVSVRGKIISVN